MWLILFDYQTTERQGSVDQSLQKISRRGQPLGFLASLNLNLESCWSNRGRSGLTAYLP